MTHVLLTGFEPFDGMPSNPSWDAVAAVAEAWDRWEELSAVLLPVEFEAAGELLERAIREHAPDLVVAVGLAAGRAAITPEWIARNLDDADREDGSGAQPRGVIDPGAPDELGSTLPIDAIVAALSAAGVPAEPSDDAGGYVCNRVFYRMLRHLDGADSTAGFIHVPATPELRPDGPSLPLETIATGLRIAIDVSLDRRAAH